MDIGPLDKEFIVSPYHLIPADYSMTVSFQCSFVAMAGCWQWCRSTCVCCLSEEEKRDIAVDKEIKRILKQQKKKERKEIKILLLGQ